MQIVPACRPGAPDTTAAPPAPAAGAPGAADAVPVMIANGWIAALYRAMKRHGKSAEDTVRICSEVSDELLRSLPGHILDHRC